MPPFSLSQQASAGQNVLFTVGGEARYIPCIGRRHPLLFSARHCRLSGKLKGPMRVGSRALLANPGIGVTDQNPGSIVAGLELNIIMSLPVGKLISGKPASLPRGVLRQVMFGATFAILGAESRPGFGFWSGRKFGQQSGYRCLPMIATMAVGLLCFRHDIVLLPVDYLFLAFVVCIASSSVMNGWTRDAKSTSCLSFRFQPIRRAA